jgi:hypothetical protein
MNGYANQADMIQCPHCGHELRRGMVRCRECGKPIAEAEPPADVGADGDFELSGHDLIASSDPTCPLCGAVLEAGTNDCPSCTSDLLDQLLKGPGAGGTSVPAPHSGSPWPSSAAAELRVRRAVPSASSTPAAARSSAEATPAEHQLRPRTQPKASPKSPAAAQPAKPPQRKAPGSSGERLRADKASAPSRALAPDESEPSDASEEDLSNVTTPVETTAACTALLASLAKAEVVLRCEIATALGKLGDKAALGPLERHLGDQDVRVRRAVAGALVQLGHPKGETLLDIAERKPAAAVIASGSAASISKPKPRKSSGGGIDSGTLKIAGVAVLAISIIGGGIYWWMNAPPSTSKSKKKSTATKKVTAPKKKALAE